MFFAVIRVIKQIKCKTMKSIILRIFAMLLLLATTTANAQDIYDLQGKNEKVNVEKKLSKKERKALQNRIDSLQWQEALRAVNDTAFTLEADQVIFKYGHRAYVSSTTNFVAINKKNATVQISFNVPVAGPNGMGGVTLDGNVSNYKITTDSKSTTLAFNVMGAIISAHLTIVIYNGSDMAQVDVMPNFNSRRISLSGRILPASQSFVVKGRAL